MLERSTIRWVAAGLGAGLAALLCALAAAASANGQASAPATGATGTGGPSAYADRLSVLPSSLLLGQTAVVTGAVPATEGGRSVALQVRLDTGGWQTVARQRAAANGTFTITWRTTRTGELTLRAASSAATVTGTALTAEDGSLATLSVYEQVLATWYGPGLYGHKTACGETLTARIVGVADRTLPCGTPVSVSYNGKTVIAPVIDRGPYAHGATLDLSHALVAELGTNTTIEVVMLPLSGPPMRPTYWPAVSTGATAPTGASGTGGAVAPASA